MSLSFYSEDFFVGPKISVNESADSSEWGNDEENNATTRISETWEFEGKGKCEKGHFLGPSDFKMRHKCARNVEGVGTRA